MKKVVHNCGILLPNNNVDLTKWAVVACDQFTSQPDYWNKLENYVGGAPSTLHLTFPEIYLKNNVEKRIDSINAAMKDYLDKGVFEKVNGFVLIERTVESGKKRLGLVICVDLDAYEFKRTRAAIRATEETILDRLPIRVKIRGNASLELPHILLLCDDKKEEIIKKIYDNRYKLKKLYDIELNMNGGHIVGYEVPQTNEIIDAFQNLLDPKVQIEKYGRDEGLLFAVGDGNHSMAAAKTHWDKIKGNLTAEERETHPARFCLTEVMSIYDEAIDFEPIHRVVIDKTGTFLSGLTERLKGNGKLRIVTKDSDLSINCPVEASATIREIQSFIEEKLAEKTCEVDYVHGMEHLKSVVNSCDGIGIVMPEFGKSELFPYILNVGNLPKKAFSIGTAENKKYYMEAKRITNN